MLEEDEPGRSDVWTTGVWLAAAAIVIMGLRGTFPMIVVPGAALAIAATVALLALLTQGCVRLYDRGLESWPGRQLLWLVPLVDLTLAFAALAVPLAIPSWIGDYELWKDLTGLPPTPFTRLVTTLFMLIAFQVGYLFMRLLGRYLSDPRSWKSGPRDGLTSLVFALGTVVLACMLLYGQARRPQNVAYLKGWVALGMAGRPADALRAFDDVVQNFPDSGLADACLYRMARIEADDLEHPAEAVAHLKKLLARFPASPFADDALHDLGEIALAQADYPAAVTAFRDVRTHFPRSYLTERAALGLARALAKSGQKNEAEQVLADLERGPSRARIVREDGDGKLIVEPLADAIAATRKGL